MAQVVQSVKRVTGPGTVLEPLITGPAISVAIAPQAGIVPLDAKSFEVTVGIHSNVKEMCIRDRISPRRESVAKHEPVSEAV